MLHIEKTVKVSSKGQITLPKQVRDFLGSDLIRITADGNSVRLDPVRDMGGSLKAYSKGYVPLKEAREKAWMDATHDKHIRG